MKIDNCHQLIYDLRSSKGITQKELAEGICSVKELRRIEKGETSPYLCTFEKILAKLGVDIAKYISNFINEDEQMRYAETLALRECLFNHEYQLAESKFLSLKERNYLDMNDPYMYQFSLLCESIFSHALHNNTQKALETAYRAIFVTTPNFKLENLETDTFIADEYVIINIIALCHIALGAIDLGIDILNRLRRSVAQKPLPIEIKWRLLPTLCYNLSKHLGLQKSYMDALDVCNEGIEVCREAKTTKSLGDLFYNKACCLYDLNEQKQASQSFQQSYNTFLIAGNHKMAEIIKKNAIEKYGIEVID